MIHSYRIVIPLIAFLTLFVQSSIFCQANYNEKEQTEEKKISLRDPQTGAIDISDLIYNAKGFMPIPIIVTEPAVGYGGGLAILYLQPQKKKYDRYVPPNIYGIAGLGTQNKTWMAALFGLYVFGPDRVRYIGAVAKLNINIKYYGNNNEFLSENPVKFNLNSWSVIQRVQVRVKNLQLFVGAAYTYFSTNNSADTIPDKPIINKILQKLNGKSTLSMIQPIINWDSRNTIFTPTKGINTGVEFSYNATWLGGDENFYKLNPYFLGYQPISKRIFSGWRFDASFIFGDPPLYALPFIQLRGVPAMQYQSNNTMVVETEWRFVVYKRWSLNTFTGMGKAFKTFDVFGDATLVYNYGIGFRYLMADKFGMDVGVDFAWSNNREFAFYLIVGSSWNK